MELGWEQLPSSLGGMAGELGDPEQHHASDEASLMSLSPPATVTHLACNMQGSGHLCWVTLLF